MRKFYRYGLGLLLGASLLTGCTAGAENVATLPLTDGTKPVFTAKEETVHHQRRRTGLCHCPWGSGGAWRADR